MMYEDRTIKVDVEVFVLNLYVRHIKLRYVKVKLFMSNSDSQHRNRYKAKGILREYRRRQSVYIERERERAAHTCSQQTLLLVACNIQR